MATELLLARVRHLEILPPEPLSAPVPSPCSSLLLLLLLLLLLFMNKRT